MRKEEIKLTIKNLYKLQNELIDNVEKEIKNGNKKGVMENGNIDREYYDSRIIDLDITLKILDEMLEN